MEDKYGEFVGVDKLNFAEITADTEAAYTTDAPEYLAPVADIAGAPEINNLTTYYDNKAANNYVTEGKTELKVIVSNVPAKLAARLLGKKYDAASGRVYDSGEPNPPDIALGFRYAMGKGGYRYYWYHKGTFSGGSEEATTKKENVDVKTYELTFTAVTTTHEWTIDEEEKSLKRVFADTADPAFDETNWFNQVQTPDTAAAPAALSLVSSDPVDGAPAVAVDSDIVLTFNNKILSQAIALFDSTFTAVPAAIAKDATGKILTITPAANLGATAEYLLVITEVIDVYGQKIENTVIDFTTV